MEEVILAFLMVLATALIAWFVGTALFFLMMGKD
jgi:hypothetical protein